MRRDPDSVEPSLAAERTDLAWNRSGLALLACGAAVLRGLARPPLRSGDFGLGLCILCLGGVTWILGAWHRARVRAERDRTGRVADPLPVSIGVSLVGLVAFVAAVISR